MSDVSVRECIDFLKAELAEPIADGPGVDLYDHLQRLAAAHEVHQLDESFDAEPFAVAAVEWAEAHSVSADLASGVAGLALMLHHCFPDEVELSASLDESLNRSRLADELPIWDFWTGVAGVLCWAAERGAAHAAGSNALDLLLAEYDRRAKDERPLGMAHGDAGVLRALAAHLKRGEGDRQAEARALATALLENIVPLEGDAGEGFRQRRARDSSARPGELSNSWCWGDPGVLRSAYVAATALGRPEADSLLERAETMAESYLRREPGDVDEWGVCCGWSGVAGILHAFHRDTNRPVFRIATNRLAAQCRRAALTVSRENPVHRNRVSAALGGLVSADGRTPSWAHHRGIGD